jgi:phthalate 4,5-cis-dihydrodiol dehydrogenase
LICDKDSDAVRLGVIGLGRGFMLMLPAFRSDRRIRLVAACAPRRESREAFAREFGGSAYCDVDRFCADPAIEAVYVATPHQLHRGHVIAACEAGKHVIVEKPLATTLADGCEMVASARRAGVQLIVGPSHSFDPPVRLARDLLASGLYGPVRMVQAFNYTDYLYRPRRPEELSTESGGGVVFSQGVHQVDVVRSIAGGKALSVSAATGKWDIKRPTEGAYCALVDFAGGAFASLTYSGYAHFDSDEWMGWRSELGADKDPDKYGEARRALAGAADEAGLKSARTYGSAEPPRARRHHEHFGPLIVSCDGADLRLTPDGVQVYGDRNREFFAAPSEPYPRAAVTDTIVAAVRNNTAPLQSGAWGLASLEVCLAILVSARERRPVTLEHQIPVGDAANV